MDLEDVVYAVEYENGSEDCFKDLEDAQHAFDTQKYALKLYAVTVREVDRELIEEQGPYEM